MFIAKRTLTFRGDSGDSPMEIRIGAPEQGDQDFACRYEIDWPDGTRAKNVYGMDSVQALELALQAIGIELYTSNCHKLGLLFLDGTRAGYGFPVPHNARDLLVGDDAELFKPPVTAPSASPPNRSGLSAG